MIGYIISMNTVDMLSDNVDSRCVGLTLSYPDGRC